MKYRTNKYSMGTPLIKYLAFDDLMAFGIVVSRTFNFYIVEWYIPNGEIETESCVEQSVKFYRDNYKEYKRSLKHKLQGKVGE